MVVRFLFWLASRISRQIPLFDFDSELRLAPGEWFAAVNAEDEVGFFGGKVAIGVGVLSEGDLDAVRGCEVGREGQFDAAPEGRPVRDGDIDRAFGIGVGTWRWGWEWTVCCAGDDADGRTNDQEGGS